MHCRDGRATASGKWWDAEDEAILKEAAWKAPGSWSWRSMTTG